MHHWSRLSALRNKFLGGKSRATAGKIGVSQVGEGPSFSSWGGGRKRESSRRAIHLEKGNPDRLREAKDSFFSKNK